LVGILSLMILGAGESEQDPTGCVLLRN